MGPTAPAIKLCVVMLLCAAAPELARAELGASHAVDAAIPRTKIAVGKHAVCKLAAQLQQAWSMRRLRQPGACPNCLPACEKNRREAVKLDPKGILAARPRIDLRGDRSSNLKLGRAPVLRNVEVPRQRPAKRWIVPNSKLNQVAHGGFLAMFYLTAPLGIAINL